MGATPNDAMFHEPPRERSFPTTAVAIAVVAIIILAATLVMISRRHGNTYGDAAYADKIAISDAEVSAASNMAGGTTTYVDGKLTNRGDRTVTGVTIQATFVMSNGSAAQVESDLAKAIRTKDPLDLQPMSQAPIPPGGTADFRLIFEDVKDGWDQKLPALKVVGATTK
jgi:hypothetical protein